MSDAQCNDFLFPRERIPFEHPGIQYDQSTRPGWDELSVAERLVLWSVRSLAETQNNWPQVQKELWLCCGTATIETVLQALHEMLTLLAVHRRRLLTVHRLGDPRLSADEVTLLTLIAAAQCGHVCKIEALARWLVRGNGHGAIIAASSRFAAGLTRSGITLTPMGAGA
jgi:hypothetical protein